MWMLPVRRAAQLIWTSNPSLQASLIRYYTNIFTSHVKTCVCIMTNKFFKFLLIFCYRTTMQRQGPSSLTTPWVWPVGWFVPHQNFVLEAAISMPLRRVPLISEGYSSSLQRYCCIFIHEYLELTTDVDF